MRVYEVTNILKKKNYTKSFVTIHANFFYPNPSGIRPLFKELSYCKYWVSNFTMLILK